MQTVQYSLQVNSNNVDASGLDNQTFFTGAPTGVPSVSFSFVIHLILCHIVPPIKPDSTWFIFLLTQ